MVKFFVFCFFATNIFVKFANAQYQFEGTDFQVMVGMESPKTFTLNPEYLKHFGNTKRLGRIELSGETHLQRQEFLSINTQAYRITRVDFLAAALEEEWSNDGFSLRVGPKANLAKLPLVGRFSSIIFDDLWFGGLVGMAGTGRRSWVARLSGETAPVKFFFWDVSFEGEIRSGSLSEGVIWFRPSDKFAMGIGVHRHNGDLSTTIGFSIGIGRPHDHEK